MHKINTDTATVDGEFTDGDEGQAIPPTELDASWFNTVQRELCNVVTGLGSVLSDSNDSQIIQALKRIGIVSEISNGNVSSVGSASSLLPIDSRLIVHSAANFSITGTLATASIIIIIPMWNSGSPDSISVSYGDEPIVIRKWNAFFGIVTNVEPFFINGYPLLMTDWDGSVTVPKITAPKVIDPNLVEFVYEEAGEGDDIDPWREWQLKSEWQVGQVKRVRCTNIDGTMQTIGVYTSTTGTVSYIKFYKVGFREFICVGEYEAVDGNKYAVLLANGGY